YRRRKAASPKNPRRAYASASAREGEELSDERYSQGIPEQGRGAVGRSDAALSELPQDPRGRFEGRHPRRYARSASNADAHREGSRGEPARLYIRHVRALLRSDG